MATEKQCAANRANSLHSTGPVTVQGKSTSSHNAVKTGLTGQTVLLKTDDVAAYNQHLERFQTKFEPATDDERDLLQDLADTEWRLLRIVPLEAGVLALGRMKLAAQFESISDEAERASLLEAEVFMTYRKDLNNLALQHTRLRRHRETVTTELNGLQTKRKNRVLSQVTAAAQYLNNALPKKDWPFNMTDFGFEFSEEEMLHKAAELRTRGRANLYPDLALITNLKDVRREYAARFGKQ